MEKHKYFILLGALLLIVVAASWYWWQKKISSPDTEINTNSALQTSSEEAIDSIESINVELESLNQIDLEDEFKSVDFSINEL